MKNAEFEKVNKDRSGKIEPSSISLRHFGNNAILYGAGNSVLRGAAFLVVLRVVFLAAFLGDLRIELSPIFCLRFNVKKLINTNYFLHLYIIPKHKVGNMVKLSQYKNLFEDKKSRKIFLSHESISCFLK